jgi:hypothetical protein
MVSVVPSLSWGGSMLERPRHEKTTSSKRMISAKAPRTRTSVSAAEASVRLRHHRAYDPCQWRKGRIIFVKFRLCSASQRAVTYRAPCGC